MDECLPIKSLEELKNWQPRNAEKHATSPLRKRTPVDSPKTLICHDMKGGYLEDRFLGGTGNEDNYYFIHWSAVDIFVYFSHHLVSLPPCGWITAAHRNGVKILGTFITEWNAGVEICNSILCDSATVHYFCMQLVSIADFFNFDGWLINIENKLNPNQVPLLEEFVRFLTLKMHESREDSLVIWYDSVIETGELKWQNELNDHNRKFFHGCDGIFLNYNWTKDTLKKSVEEAGSRRTDVFVGVDVFGRGCLGGGGFSTDIAVTAARDFNLSVAIFAPGWVYECHDVKDFKENQFKFWNSLRELCGSRITEDLPYYTSFCPGFGKKMYKNGKVECSEPWFNLSLQQPQPSFCCTNCCVDVNMLYINNEDAFNGGGCLQLTGKICELGRFVEFELLSTNFLINSVCCISYTFKTLSKNVKVALALNVYNNKKNYQLNFVEKSGCDNEERPPCLCSNCGTVQKNIHPTSMKIISGSIQDTPWIKRKYKLCCHEKEKCFVKKVKMQVSCEEISVTEITVLLGELKISPYSDGILFSYKDLTIIPKDESSVIVECILEWTQDTSIHFSKLYVVINATENYLCTTSQFYYKFQSCINKIPEIEFILRPNSYGKNLQPKILRIPLC